MADRQLSRRGNLFARLLYIIVRNLVVLWCRVWLRLVVVGQENLPKEGAFIVAPTHRSNLDIPVTAAVTTRRLRFMGKDSLWKYRPVGLVLSALGGFPVTRGTADLEALKRCVEVLKGGEPLVLFPEGTRRSGPIVNDLFDGAAFVAVKAGVPIVPVGIAGTEEAMEPGSRTIGRARCVMVIGSPIRETLYEGRRASRDDLAKITAQLQDRLQVLLNDATSRVERRNQRRK